MRSLLEQAAQQLEAEGIPFALIGATAMAAHGVSRATQDVDLLVTFQRSLASEVWEPLRAGGAEVEVRLGDDDDPLLGLVRIRAQQQGNIDIVAGKGRWQAEIIGRAQAAIVDASAIPIAEPADLILLKLYAGGLQDRWDIAQLLAAGTDDLPSIVEGRLDDLPERCAELWQQIRTHPAR